MKPKNKKSPARLAAWGRKGGKATGSRKARSSAQARAAVNARWAKARRKAAPS